MRDRESDVRVEFDNTIADITGLPEQLPGDPRRQAVSSFLGDAYQAWWSIDAWLRLSDANEVVYLEGAEDFEAVGFDAATTVQVRGTIGTISLGTAKAQTALENFWTLSSRERYRKIQFHYLTTSSIAKEQDSCFGDFKGIEVWQAARTNAAFAVQISTYLLMKLGVSSPLRLFLSLASPEEIQEYLIKRFYWLTDQPDLEAVKKSVDDRIVVLLSNLRQPLALVPNVRKNLESRYGEILLQRSSAERCLTHAELLRQVEAATITYVPVPVGQLSTLISSTRPGFGLLSILLDKSPKPPEPLLRRPELTQRLEEFVNHRKVVLLTGTVYKGKTTAAQLISSTLCPEAWWVGLTGREPAEVDTLFVAMASRIESGGCPSLVIIDDLDISPAAHRTYRDSLAVVIHRAATEGHGIILTARGASSEPAITKDFANLELLEIPEMSPEETEVLCTEHGCPRDIAAAWGFLISTSTQGHPKLVQVWLAELAANDWPKPSVTDLTRPSPAVISARQMARQLLSDTVSMPVAEFVYLVSECSVPLDRSVAIRLAESVQGLKNGGDVLDSLTGRWLERFEGQLYRCTALLSGAAAEVWSSVKRKEAHVHLHDALRAKQVLSPSEAAALLFHAYFAGDSARLFCTASMLQTIDIDEARREVEKQLFWLPCVALEAGQTITDNPMAEVMLRSLQFHVASSFDSDSLPQVCARWKDGIERIAIPPARSLNQAMMSLFVGFAESGKVPLKYRLDAIMEIQLLPAELSQELKKLGKRFLEEVNETGEMPQGGTFAQAIFLNASSSFRGLNDLRELITWLDNTATDEIRQQFDSMLEWPITQMLGAFVQTAWASVHEQTKDWEPWIALLERVENYAERKNSPWLGREAAKARATILTEYLDRAPQALRVLEQAETVFGQSIVLTEQRANILFQTQNDVSVLEIWDKLVNDPDGRRRLDPYAYRRAGMSAARLKKWDKAQEIFCAAARSIQEGSYEITKFGLQVDAALSASLGGHQTAAAMLLADAVCALPAEAAQEGNGRWEAVQRTAVMVCGIIENSIWKRTEGKEHFDPGYASSPDLKVSRTELGQAARSEMTRGQILCLAATTGKDTSKFAKEVESLARSRYFSVRWFAAEARLALSYSAGAGEGFIEALLSFERNMLDFLINMQNHQSPFDPDDGPVMTLPIAPERWFGLLCAGLICTGSDLLTRLEIWLKAADYLLGEPAALTNDIRLLFQGASLPADLLHSTVIDTTASPAVRCGAAAKLLVTLLPAETVLRLQAFLTSALVSNGSAVRQSIFNLHVARRFADAWRTYEQSGFLFYSPSTSVPALLATLEGLEHGSTTLRNVLVAAATALQQPLGEFMGRVL